MHMIDKKSRLTHRVSINDSPAVQINRICVWCHKQFGIRFSIVDREMMGQDGVWQCMYRGGVNGDGLYEFSFDHGQDAVLFALKWAS